MVAFLVVFGGFPVLALPIASLAIGLILGISAQGFMSSLIQGFQYFVVWLFNSIPLSWTLSSTEELQDGTVMDHYTWFGEILNFIRELVFMIPSHGTEVIATSIFGYFIFELLAFFLMVKIAVRKKGRAPILNEQEQRPF